MYNRRTLNYLKIYLQGIKLIKISGRISSNFFQWEIGRHGRISLYITTHGLFFKHFTILKYCLFNKGNDNDVSKLVLGKVLLQLPNKLLFPHKCSWVDAGTLFKRWNYDDQKFQEYNNFRNTRMAENITVYQKVTK